MFFFFLILGLDCRVVVRFGFLAMSFVLVCLAQVVSRLRFCGKVVVCLALLCFVLFSPTEARSDFISLFLEIVLFLFVFWVIAPRGNCLSWPACFRSKFCFGFLLCAVGLLCLICLSEIPRFRVLIDFLVSLSGRSRVLKVCRQDKQMDGFARASAHVDA